MQSYLISIIIKHLLREGVSRIQNPEELKAKAEKWIRAELGGWQEQVAVSTLNIAWAIIFSEVEKYLKEVGFDFLAENQMLELSARSECTARVCSQLDIVA